MASGEFMSLIMSLIMFMLNSLNKLEPTSRCFTDYWSFFNIKGKSDSWVLFYCYWNLKYIIPQRTFKDNWIWFITKSMRKHKTITLEKIKEITSGRSLNSIELDMSSIFFPFLTTMKQNWWFKVICVWIKEQGYFQNASVMLNILSECKT